MRYMGGKTRIARRVVEAIMQDTEARSVWFEPFVGGGNVLEHAAPVFGSCFAADGHLDLIMMWEHVTAGGLLPSFITREHYQELRHQKPSWIRGYAGFGASFGGKWFGGYGYDERLPDGNEVIRSTRRAVERQAGVFMKYRVRFTYARFGDITPPVGAVVYCDPPYAGTTTYSSMGGFDYRLFYDTLRKWAADRYVYVSEYAIPEDVPHRVIWEREKRNALKKDDNQRVALERLYRILP